MNLLFVLMIASMCLGGVLLWLSGWTVGRRRGDDESDTTPEEAEAMLAENARVTGELKKVSDQLDGSRSDLEEATRLRHKVEAELNRVAIEMGRVESEMQEAETHIGKLKEENELLKKEATKTKPKPPVPPPRPKKKEAAVSPPAAEPSEELDDVEALLDMERVAHRRTKEELEQIKKLAAVMGGSSGPPVGMGGAGNRRGAGFKTMSIDTRSSQVSGTEHDRLRQAHDQLQREKDRVEADLARAQQELQLLKMRQE